IEEEGPAFAQVLNHVFPLAWAKPSVVRVASSKGSRIESLIIGSCWGALFTIVDRIRHSGRVASSTATPIVRCCTMATKTTEEHQSPAQTEDYAVMTTAFLRLAAAFLILPLLTAPSQAAAAGDKPSIVIILADDLGYGDVHGYNAQSKIPTPNLDRLAAEGIRFTDAHAPDSVCTPTRYGLLTGRCAFRSRLKSGVLPPWGQPLIEEGRLTLPEIRRSGLV